MASFWREHLTAWLREPALYLAASVESRWRQAEALGALDERLLRDIGLSAREGHIGRPANPVGPGNWPLSGPSVRDDSTGFGSARG